VGDILSFVLGNFTLTFFVIGLLVSAASLVRAPHRSMPVVVEALFKWFLFFSIGISYIYNALFHVCFGAFAARLIGWPDSPFQTEVGFASLGFGVVGMLATSRGFEMRLAAILGPAFFLWGAAGVHVYSMITAHNFAPGNAGVIFWSDVLVPIVGFSLLGLQRRFELQGRSPAPRARA
jgi:hypothetical protein